MIMDAIVSLAGAFAVLFLAAWLISPKLRVWIERPKYRFLEDVQSADMQGADMQSYDKVDHEPKHT
jgi:hypothetical protein